jgi:hypothetical protein
LRHNVVPLRHARRMSNDKEQIQAEQRDAPGGETPHEVKRSWVTVLAAEAHHVGDTLLDAAALYGATEAVHKVVDKIRKPPPDPGPGGSDGEQK